MTIQVKIVLVQPISFKFINMVFLHDFAMHSITQSCILFYLAPLSSSLDYYVSLLFSYVPFGPKSKGVVWICRHWETSVFVIFINITIIKNMYSIKTVLSLLVEWIVLQLDTITCQSLFQLALINQCFNLQLSGLKILCGFGSDFIQAIVLTSIGRTIF